MSKITVIDTGGTMSKVPGRGLGVRDLEIGPPYAVNYLREQAGEFANFICLPLVRKDSLDMTHDDRLTIAEVCEKEPAHRIIIVHGTDSMLMTAEVLFRSGIGTKKTIVLTGALLPAAIKGTDADFQLGLALAACVCQPKGIWVAMNGVFASNSCRKHPVTGQFVRI